MSVVADSRTDIVPDVIPLDALPVRRHARAPGARVGLLRALVLLPPAVTVVLVWRLGVNVPFWDEWVIAGFLRDVDRGTLTLASLFSQHNEHRMFIPRVVQIAGAWALGWDTRVSMWVSQALLLFMLGGCTVLWRRAVATTTAWSLLSLALLSALLYSPAQHQNFFWGFQVCFFLPAACLLAAVLVASSSRTTLGGALAAAAGGATVATFSIVPGLLTWPLGAAVVFGTHGRPRRDVAWHWCLWLAACAGVIALYFFRYEPPQTPSMMPTLHRPLAIVVGIAACVGSPLRSAAHPLRSAVLVGTAAIAAFAWLTWCVYRRRRDARLVASAAPWIVMGAFGLSTAAAITAGRLAYGYVALLESRYASWTIWILVGLVALASVLREHDATPGARRRWAIVCGGIAIVYALSLPTHLAALQEAHRERLQSQAVYAYAEAAPTSSPILPPWANWPAFKQLRRDLERTGWRRAEPSAPTWIETDDLRQYCSAGTVEVTMQRGAQLMAGGWAYLPTAGRAADAVLVTSGPSRRVILLQPPVVGRRDIGERFQTDAALVSGFILDARPSTDDVVEFWAFDVAASRAYRLCEIGSRGVH